MVIVHDADAISLLKFHGLVEHGHEARVHLQHNSNIIMHMYDRDYSGSNGRYEYDEPHMHNKLY